MGTFEFVPFLLGALIPGGFMIAVAFLALTPRRSSIFQLILSIVTLAYGIGFACLIGLSSAFSPWMVLYGLPSVTGGIGILLWIRSRARR